MEPYRAPFWLPGPHLQTVIGGLWPQPRIAYVRERWITPDCDFIDVDWAGPEHAPRLLVLFHGVGGNSSAAYVRALAALALATSCWRVAVPHFRGCSGEPNRLPRSYFSGDHEEIDWILERCARRRSDSSDKLYAVGNSLGGNSLLKWLCEKGEAAKLTVHRAATISAQFDLAKSGKKLESGLNRIYGWWLIGGSDGLRSKALAKFDRFPAQHEAAGVQRDKVQAASTFPEFDDALVAPLHGFGDKANYWAKASALGQLARIAVPTLLLNARNDPFNPASALPDESRPPAALETDFPDEGGHGNFPSCRKWLARRVLGFLSRKDPRPA